MDKEIELLAMDLYNKGIKDPMTITATALHEGMSHEESTMVMHKVNIIVNQLDN
jgi:hypothetical protein